MNLNETPRANRLHIGLFGKRNSGKSSLINALTGQNIAIVSPFAGTTADPVFKAMELHPIGPVVFIDTAGFDDEGQLGLLRVEKTREVMEKTDVAILVCAGDDLTQEKIWFRELRKRNIPVIGIINKVDLFDGADKLQAKIAGELGIDAIPVSALNETGLKQLKNALLENIPETFEMHSITGQFVKEGDVVVLVMPQDIQAPKGRLILPQVQTIRDLLDKSCITVCTTAEKLQQTLKALSMPPKLIITDSQCFKEVYALKPKNTDITSFSVLFAAYKGDIHTFVEGASKIDSLDEQSRILIAEACTHAPLTEDIGRVKIPRMLRNKVGENLHIDIVSGNDFPEELSEYDLIIHCGGCMFNRKYMLSRLERAAEQGVSITNYGVVMAKLTGILEHITI